MKRLGLSSAILGSTLLMAQSASAAQFLEDITWVPQIGVQYKQLKFEQDLKLADGSRQSGDLSADIPALAVSFTAIYKKGYLSLQYADSLDNVTTDSDVPFTDSDTEVQRRDFGVTLGYNVWDRLNLFVGYMDGETTLTPEPLCPVDTTVAFPDCGNGGIIGQVTLDGNLAQDMYVNGQQYEQEYTEDGWYFGGSYGWKLMDTGTLSLSAAYADLNATYKDNYFPEENADYKFSGNADGFSFGLNWSQPLTQHMGYYLDVRTQKYDANTKDDNGNFQGYTSETSETITTFTAGVQWNF